jgi:outer membrane protein, heavy metal efflux system
MSADLVGPRQCVVGRARARFCAAVLAAPLLAFITHVGAQAPALTERQVVEMALSQAAYRAAEDARIGVAESAVVQSGILPNPVISAGHERTNVTGGRSTESTVQVSQTFDIAGRRQMRRDAAERRLEAVQWDRDAARSRFVAELRGRFADVLYTDRLRAAVRDWLARVETAYKVVVELQKAGDASGYERRRLERERIGVQARFARAEADYRRGIELLLGAAGIETGSRSAVVGELIPTEPPMLAFAREALRQRPELKSLAAQAEAFERERRVADRAWIPDLTVGAGVKRVEEPGRTDSGPIFSISIPLPLFERGQAAQQRAIAEASTARAEQTLRLNRWEAELRAAWVQADELRRAALVFRQDAATSSRDLGRIAEAAYRGGEVTLLELLDAYRNELEAETTSLELEVAARHARIELDLLTGMVTYE